MRRPNHSNAHDACCACSKTGIPTPADHERPGDGELMVWQPDPTDIPQWICAPCHARLSADVKRNA